jgi:hypothetical protein
MYSCERRNLFGTQYTRFSKQNDLVKKFRLNMKNSIFIHGISALAEIYGLKTTGIISPLAKQNLAISSSERFVV